MFGYSTYRRRISSYIPSAAAGLPATSDSRRSRDMAQVVMWVVAVTVAVIAFGTGPHICLGMHLTRIESHAALERILDRAPHIRLDPDEPPPRIRGTVLRSPDAVNVLLR